MKAEKRYCLQQLADLIGAEIQGDADCQIDGVCTLTAARRGQISFLADKRYVAQLKVSQASAVVLSAEHAGHFTGNALVISNPYLGFAKITQLFDNRPKTSSGIHPTAVIADSAQISESAAIGPTVCIEANVVVGADTVIGAGCYIGENCQIGTATHIAANATVHHGTVIGDRVIIHSGAVIGADGFGFASDAGKWEKIVQLGGVEIGDDVEVGASSSIDRGALGNTVIETGVKIDNQVMVAHNVRIGAHTAVAGCVGISGSADIGAYCTLAGGVGVVGHIKIADRVHITGMTMVTKSIDTPGSYSSGTAMMPTGLWKKNSVQLRKLVDLSQRVKELEKQLEQLKGEQA